MLKNVFELTGSNSSSSSKYFPLKENERWFSGIEQFILHSEDFSAPHFHGFGPHHSVMKWGKDTRRHTKDFGFPCHQVWGWHTVMNADVFFSCSFHDITTHFKDLCFPSPFHCKGHLCEMHNKLFRGPFWGLLQSPYCCWHVCHAQVWDCHPITHWKTLDLHQKWWSKVPSSVEDYLINDSTGNGCLSIRKF